MSELTEKTISVGVVVVVYHSWERVIRYIKEDVPKLGDCRTVIVDSSACEADSRKLAEACAAEYVDNSNVNVNRKVFLINSAENLGYARGNNLGADFLYKYFAPHYLLFSNDDVSITDSALMPTLIKTMHAHDNIGIIGPRIIGFDGQDQSPHYRVISPYRHIAWKYLPFLRRRKKTQTNAGELQISGFCYWVSGAFLMVDAEVFRQVGGFDPRTFLYCEEIILSERFLRKGLKCYFESSICVIHEGGGSSDGNTKIMRQRILEGMMIYYRDYRKYPKLTIWIYHWLMKE